MKPLYPGRGRIRRKVAQIQTWRPTYDPHAAPYTAEGPRSGRTTNSREQGSMSHCPNEATCMGCLYVCQAKCQVEKNLMEAAGDYYCRDCREDMADMLRNALKRYGWNSANDETKTVVGDVAQNNVGSEAMKEQQEIKIAEGTPTATCMKVPWAGDMEKVGHQAEGELVEPSVEKKSTNEEMAEGLEKAGEKVSKNRVAKEMMEAYEGELEI